jgi:hypothetical protein
MLALFIKAILAVTLVLRSTSSRDPVAEYRTCRDQSGGFEASSSASALPRPGTLPRCGTSARPMTARGHSRRGRAAGTPGHVRYAA